MKTDKLFIPNMLFGNEKFCTYCGYKPDETDHVIPISSYQVANRSAYKNFGLKTYSCHNCNFVLYDRVFNTFFERMQYMQGYYNKQFIANYSNKERQPSWTEEELKELDYNLKTFVVGKLSKQKETKRKARRSSRYNDSRLVWLVSSSFQRIMRELKSRPQFDPKSDQFVPWLFDYFIDWLK